MDSGVERIVDQVTNPKIYSVIQPEIERVTYNHLGMEKPDESEGGETKLLNPL